MGKEAELRESVGVAVLLRWGTFWRVWQCGAWGFSEARISIQGFRYQLSALSLSSRCFAIIVMSGTINTPLNAFMFDIYSAIPLI